MCSPQLQQFVLFEMAVRIAAPTHLLVPASGHQKANPASTHFFIIMAYAPNNSAPAATTQNTAWKASGFLNFFLPTQGGKPRKLGAIALKDSNVNEKRLLDWLNENPTENAAKLLAAITVEYRSAEPTESAGFVIPE